MRELEVCEISYVGGGPTEGDAGSPISTAVGTSCSGLPSSANVTVTIGTPGWTLGGIGFSSGTAVSATVNCGEFNAANNGSSGSPSSPRSSSASSGGYTPYRMGQGPYIVEPIGNYTP